MKKKLEEENEELRRELIKSKRNEVTPEMWAGGAVGVVIYIIYKGMNGYGWHAGDVVGLFLLAFLPGALFIGQLFNFKK